MNITVLSSIRYLFLQDVDFIKTPLFTIHSHPLEKDRVIDKDFKSRLGIKFEQSLRQNIFTYIIIPIENGIEEEQRIRKILDQEIYTTSKQLETFLFFLWFIKDNSISADDTYGYIPETTQCGVHINHTIYSNSSGEGENVHFSKKEIFRAADILFKYIEVCPAKSASEEATEFFKNITNAPGKYIFKSGINDDSEANNLQRAMTFLNTARSISYLPYKIALYIPILESLFCYDEKYHIKDKVSERVAFYMSKDNRERENIKATIKDAYDIRSIFLHGEKLDASKREPNYLKLLSSKIDEIARSVLTKIIMEDSIIFLQKDLKSFLRSITNLT